MCLGRPGQIVEFVDDERNIAKVDVSGIKRNVNASLVKEDNASIGDWVLIHVGFAMSILDEKEAQNTLKFLRELDGGLEEEMQMLKQSDIN